MQWIARGLALAFVLYGVEASGAEGTVWDTFQIHGFASQGYVLTSNNNFFGESRRGGSFDFRELGVNASWLALPNLQLSFQVLSRWAGEGDEGEPRVDYGFVDYSVISDAKNLWGLRLGRIASPLGLYNDTRDVAFTRPSILLPQSIYFDRARNLALSADGAQIYGERRSKAGDFLLQLEVVRPRVGSKDDELALFGSDLLGELEPEVTTGGRLLYEKDGGRIRLALTGFWLNTDYDPGAGDTLGPGSILFTPVIFSAQYDAERWSLTGEYALRHFEFEDFGPARPDTSLTGESFYVQGTYRFSPDWEGFLRYDVLFNDRNDRSGKEAAKRFNRPAHAGFAKDWTIGLRWDITPRLMLRTEFHRVNGTAWITLQDNPDINATKQHWSLFSILASYRF